MLARPQIGPSEAAGTLERLEPRNSIQRLERLERSAAVERLERWNWPIFLVIVNVEL
jgi:hypothetical protein